MSDKGVESLNNKVGTGPGGAVAMSPANDQGSHLGTGSNPERVFKGPVNTCKATTPSSF